MVKRYQMQESLYGPYVQYKDYHEVEEERDACLIRLAEVEAQRDMLKNVLIFIKDECDWEPTYHENGGDERIGDVIREALAKLEEE